jgi:Transposase DDE domain
MKLQTIDQPAYDDYLAGFDRLIGDKRTEGTYKAVIEGIIGSESLRTSQIARSSPMLAQLAYGEKRVRRLANGSSRQRSQLDAEHVTAVLRQTGVEALHEADALTIIMDMSEVRRAGATEQETLMRVMALDGELVNGYRSLNVLGLGGEARGVLYHRLFSSTQPAFQSENREILTAINAVEASLSGFGGGKTWVMDSGFDNDDVWWAIWAHPGSHIVCRVYHRERLVQWQSPTGQWEERYLDATFKHMQRWVRLETTLEVRLVGQPRAKRQPVTVEVSSVPIRVYHPVDKQQTKAVWLVRVTLLGATNEPWYLLTDWPVNSPDSARRVFIFYRQRWSVEDTFKFVKTCFGMEQVQMLSFEAVRTLVAFAWVAAGFLFHLGLTLDEVEVRLLARLGGWEERPNRPPGKICLTRGLQRLLEAFATQAILADHIKQFGDLPPFIKHLKDSFNLPDLRW